MGRPPRGARKVPGFDVWMTEAGEPFRGDGRPIAVSVNRGGLQANCPKDSGGRTTKSLATLMSSTWMPPRPEGCHVVHLDGDALNYDASNLAWAPPKSLAELRRRWAARKLAEMSADPGHPAHGTRLGYNAGCRCELCRRRMRVLNREKQTMKRIEEIERMEGLWSKSGGR